MPWAAGSYTKGNAGTGGWTGDASLGIGIEAGRHDTQDNDFATGINQCLNKDGSNAMTGNLNAGGNKVVSMAAGTADTDGMRYGQVRDGYPVYLDTANQRFGLGTTSVTNRLTVVGTGQTGAPSDAGNKAASIRVSALGGSSQDGGQIEFGAGYGSWSQSYFAAIKALAVSGTNNSTGDLVVYSRANDTDSTLTERLRWDTFGRVFIRNSTSGSYFDGTLNVESTPTAITSCLKQTNGAGTFVSSFWNNATTSNNSFCVFVTEATPAARGSITYNRASNVVAYNTSSDERLKTNITNAPSALPVINAIQIRSFDWKETGNHMTFGAIAQELVNVAPQAVTVGDSGENIEQVWGVDFSQLVPPVVKSIQELCAKIESLEARIEALEA
jgi:hypothetical protein